MTQTTTLAVKELVGDAAPFRELADQLRALIANDSLSPGEALPSTRALGDKVGIAPNTVHRAYQVLVEEGLLRKSWSGFVVVGARELSDIRRQRLRKAVREFRKDLDAQGYSTDEINAAMKEGIQ